MAPFKNILVPTDFSAESDKALRYATALAEASGGVVTLLHVMPPPSLVGDAMATWVEGKPLNHENEVQDHLREVLQRVVGERVPTRTLVKHGETYRQVMDAAKEMAADLLVCGAHTHSTLERMLLRHTAEHLVREAPCPVLTVKDEEREFVSG